MSVMSSLRRQVFGVPPYSGMPMKPRILLLKKRAWVKKERDSRTKIHARGVAIRDREYQKKLDQQTRREAAVS